MMSGDTDAVEGEWPNSWTFDGIVRFEPTAPAEPERRPEAAD